MDNDVEQSGRHLILLDISRHSVETFNIAWRFACIRLNNNGQFGVELRLCALRHRATLGFVPVGFSPKVGWLGEFLRGFLPLLPDLGMPRTAC